jgi:peptidoglycan/xylan/chitin deacetylase (PgdA/CDA1 family)
MKDPLKRSVHTILAYALSVSMLIVASCDSGIPVASIQTNIARSVPVNVESVITKPAKVSDILNRPQVPILCYHQIRDWSASDSKRAKDYIVPVNNFRDQIKFLADNGYHSISPDQLYKYLLNGTPLPSKPIMITFDDTREEQYSIADKELSKYGFKGVYFVMTVSLNKPGYMTKEQVKQLSDEGNTVGSHTWDHSNVKNYVAADWVKQIDKPSKQLEEITGKPIQYFAYPFGLWNKEAVEQIKQRGFKAAFQLSEKRDELEPQFTIRRMIVPGEWSVATLQRVMEHTF